MSIAASGLSETAIARPEALQTGGKTPPKRLTVATAEAPLVPEAR